MFYWFMLGVFRMSWIFYPNFLSIRKNMFFRMVDLVMRMFWIVHADWFVILWLLGFVFFMSWMSWIINADLLSIR